jgi:hypothetical protein
MKREEQKTAAGRHVIGPSDGDGGNNAPPAGDCRSGIGAQETAFGTNGPLETGNPPRMTGETSWHCRC